MNTLSPDTECVMVLFSNPKFCAWVIPNDTRYAYHIASFRTAEKGRVAIVEYEDLRRVPRRFDERHPFTNAVAALPRDEKDIDITARLLWRDDFEPSEIWFFTYGELEHLADAAHKAGAEAREVPLFPYHHNGPPLQCLRMRSAESVKAFMLARPLVSLECTWLAFRGLSEQAFNDFQLCEGADVFLFEAMTRGSNLKTVFLTPTDWEEAWRYSIKQDAWRHESGDPLFCVRSEETDVLERNILRLSESRGYQAYRSKLSETVFLNFVQGGEIAVSASIHNAAASTT